MEDGERRRRVARLAIFHLLSSTFVFSLRALRELRGSIRYIGGHGESELGDRAGGIGGFLSSRAGAGGGDRGERPGRGRDRADAATGSAGGKSGGVWRAAGVPGDL